MDCKELEEELQRWKKAYSENMKFLNELMAEIKNIKVKLEEANKLIKEKHHDY